MSDARRLRRADKQRLEVIAAALTRGRFAIVVADDAAWPLVARQLGLTPAAELTLATGADVIAMFASPATAADGVVVLHLGEHAGPAIAALNLNRDKLQGRPCRFLLHLTGPAFQRFVREAPDAYSVRDGVAVIETHETVELDPAPLALPDHVHEALSGARSPEALVLLGQELLDENLIDEGHEALDRGIAMLSQKRHLTPGERSTLAALHYYRADREAAEARRQHVREALRVLSPVRAAYEAQYVNILGQLSDYYGTEIEAAREAHAAAARHAAGDTDHAARQLLALADACAERDDVRGARAALAQISARLWSTQLRYYRTRIEAGVLVGEGRAAEAQRRLHEALREVAGAHDRGWSERFALQLATLLVRAGELDEALATVARLHDEPAEELRRVVGCWRGEPEALGAAEISAAARRSDPSLSRAIARLRADAEWVRLGARAGLLPEGRTARMDALIAEMAARVRDLAPADPPWSRIDAELLVADNLLAREGQEAGAARAAERALAFARAGAPECVALCVRRVAVAALREGGASSSATALDALLDEADRSAEAHHLPGEAARLAGLRLWLAVRRGDPPASAEAAMDAAFARSGSSPVAAEVLLRVGRGAGRRDLVGRARKMYRALGRPEREGACFEALGMPSAARDRYEAYGFRLAALALERGGGAEPVDA